MGDNKILQSRLGGYWVLISIFVVVMTTRIAMASVVGTLSGEVMGFTENVLGVDVDTYLGIPYAEPPLGPLRFRAPRQIPKWTGVKQTLTLPNACMQLPDTSFGRFRGVESWNPNTNVSEDCLYLNLWVPNSSPGERLSTIIWIYGGSFVAGSATLDVYNGKYLAAKQSVIVASMQYRLGVQGFLYSGTDEAPGNMGLLDQQLAMKWIYENIDAFNGDNTKITLMGESAGSVSVNHHLLASSSWPFFNNAIMLSSTSFANWAWEPPTYLLNKLYRFASVMRCDVDEVDEIMECLRNADANDLEAKQWELDNKNIGTFSPVIDGSFLTNTPEQLVASGRIKNANILLGSTKDEGEYFLIYFYQNVFKPENLWNPIPLTRTEFIDVMKQIGQLREGVELESVLYTYEESVLPFRRPTYRDILDDLLGDVYFKCSVHDFAGQYSSQNPVKGQTYVYSYEYRQSVNPWPSWMGVLHGYEIEMVFGLPFNPQLNYSAEDRVVSNNMMDYFISFAKTGSPNTQHTQTTWPEYSTDREAHVVFTQETDVVVKDNYRRKECSFWTELFPKIRTIEDRMTVNGCVGLSSPWMAVGVLYTLVMRT